MGGLKEWVDGGMGGGCVRLKPKVLDEVFRVDRWVEGEVKPKVL
jgi:hypothetical protein